MQLRTIVIVSLGVTVCAAILVSVPLLWMFSAAAQEPFDKGPAAIFSVGALAVCGISVRAFFRARKESAGEDWMHVLALATPVFVVIGVAIGIWFSFSLDARFQETRASDLRDLCAVPQVWGLNLATCADRAAACRSQGFAAPLTKDSPEVAALQQRLDGLRKQIDDEQWAIEKKGGFHDSGKVRPYDELAERLRWSSDRADIARGAMVCLSNAAR